MKHFNIDRLSKEAIADIIHVNYPLRPTNAPYGSTPESVDRQINFNYIWEDGITIEESFSRMLEVIEEECY